MKQHKNDFNPGPLTESVCSGRSCYQANLPVNIRASVELPVEGHHRLKSIPQTGSPGIEQVKADGASHNGLKHRTKAQTGNPGIIHLFPQLKLPGFLHCLEVTEFRRRIMSLQTDPEKTEMVVLYPIPGKEIPQGRNVEILPGKTIEQTLRNVLDFRSRLIQRTRKGNIRLKTCFRWRKTMSLTVLVFSPKKLEFLWRETRSITCWVISLIEQEFLCTANSRIFEPSKLRLCQS
jgi:hypothetical protein